MRTIALLTSFVFQLTTMAQSPVERYPADPASVEHPGVPKGEIIKFSFESSKIFPGTSRDYWIYIPAQYRPSSPACVYINQDGIQYNAPVVFDNLIHQKEMPVTIGVFIMPGRVRASKTDAALDRVNRSFEYDGISDDYARFLLEELLPEVEKKKAGDGRQIRLSHNGNDRAIGGASSGAACAFTAAWEKPEEFSRVFSAIGTYVGLRGADRYATLVRKYEPKPIRIYLQDGANDLNIFGGDWWKANETMERALTFAGYEVNHSWGEGGHSGNHATAIFPEAIRWLWKGWPAPVGKGKSQNKFLSDLIIDGENWELVGEGYRFTEGTASNAAGEVFYQDIPNSKTYKVSREGKLTTLSIDARKASGTSFGADGKRYTTAGATKQILRFDDNEKESVVASDIAGNDLVVAKNGNIYVTSPGPTEKTSVIYMIRPNGEKIVADSGFKYPNGLALTPDQTQLYVAESESHWVWIFSIRADGSLTNKQRFGWLNSLDTEDAAWADGLKCDSSGRLYVATQLGIQVLDQLGRLNAVIPVPSGQASNLCFGGPGFNTMYVSCGKKVYRRKFRVYGVNSFEEPRKPRSPDL